ncbi:BMP family lipoprotein [Azospirillum halopraeferens]|uniref:BMP family lipoprotein n=1 Tax=Azospirillum halopraeferens TaxID=34010 RepID=UPI00048E00FA|nr:BMP family ABC transporter substrate-binding protein [Azospirillum halopraeferens]
MPRLTRRRFLALTLASAAAAPAGRSGGAAAAGMAPALIYAVGQKFDKSFNEGAYHGAQAFTAETGIGVIEAQPQAVAQFAQTVNAAVRRGATDVVVIGFYYATPLAEVADRHPTVRFTIVDAVVDRPNVQSVVFKEQEGSFLVGVLAALASKTGTIGFIGAMDIPLLRKFIAGFEQGARHARPDVRTLVNFVGATPDAFNDPATGAEVARSQFERGADVVFAGAGTSNFGIFSAARDAGRLAIGVDANQNPLQPGTILTSMLKRTDEAVKRALHAARDGTWTPGVRSLGLEEGAVDYAVDEHNRPLLSPAMVEAAEQARRAIIEGRITVAVP